MQKELIDKAFIVNEHWGNLILDGLKSWEIRGAGTQADIIKFATQIVISKVLQGETF